MKVLTFSTSFPGGHPKASQPTWFVEKIFSSILPRNQYGILNLNDIPYGCRHIVNDFALIDNEAPKHHTIRAGSRWKAGDMASLRIWSGKPYQSKQIEFAQVEVKSTWPIKITIINGAIGISINDVSMKGTTGPQIARNDGLEWIDFVNWFNIHPKRKHQVFTGQIICWSDKVNYTPLTEKVK